MKKLKTVESLVYILQHGEGYFWHWIFGEGYPHKVHVLITLTHEQYHKLKSWFAEEGITHEITLNGYSIHMKISEEEGKIIIRNGEGRIVKDIERTLGDDQDSDTFRAMLKITRTIIGDNSK